MNQLEKRVDRLEGATGGTSTVRVICIVPMTADMGKPADPQPETTGVACLTTGEGLLRNPGEGADDFRERAAVWATGRSSGVSLLMLTKEGD